MPEEAKIRKYLKDFSLDKADRPGYFRKTVEDVSASGENRIRVYVNEFWTSRQRQAASIHEISYRACFKPQLPQFFINLLTEPEQVVYDPFSGRGTTAIEAALNNRNFIANDINPLSKILCLPRLTPPSMRDLETRLAAIPFDDSISPEIDLSMFYHPQTEVELLALRSYLLKKKESGKEDYLDRWIRMVATSRLTGHSKGFFSVYTMPPNQAVSAERQRIINMRRKQSPEYRNVKKLIMRKSRQLVRNLTDEQLNYLKNASESALFYEDNAADTYRIKPNSIDLTVTSPPFMDVVQYSDDNWLRLWFNSIDQEKLDNKITVVSRIEEWSLVMNEVLKELYRITRSDGWVAFEVGEVKSGRIKLENEIIPLALKTGFKCFGVLINSQNFTKTSNIWGIKNNCSGTNSNRIVLLKKFTGHSPVII
ncbi:MAG: DNA methyltransferase [Dethiobacteria bacterium]